MNRIKISKNVDAFERKKIKELKTSLQMIKASYSSNEQIIQKLQEAIQNEEQQLLYDALQKDMQLINDQLENLLKIIHNQ